jgi:hypothetical protein
MLIRVVAQGFDSPPAWAAARDHRHFRWPALRYARFRRCALHFGRTSAFSGPAPVFRQGMLRCYGTADPLENVTTGLLELMEGGMTNDEAWARGAAAERIAILEACEACCVECCTTEEPFDIEDLRMVIRARWTEPKVI